MVAKRASILLCVALLGVFVCPVPEARAAAPTVIVLSWDGVHPTYLERGSFPALERMVREGARAERLIPVWPTNTFPNHVALATGTYTDRHGIVNNSFVDAERGRFHYEDDAGWLEAEPLWVAAERQGVRAATFFWVGSGTDWRGTGATYRRAPFDSKVDEREKVDQILEWIGLPEGERPGLVMSWWHGADSVGHSSGPSHEKVRTQLAEQDRELGRLLEGLDLRGAWAWTTLIVVSDHGMVEVSEALDLSQVLDAKAIRARVIAGGGVAHVYLEDPREASRAAGVLNGIEGVRAFMRNDLPEQLRGRHPVRSGEVIALTDPPRAFARLGAAERGWIALRDLFGHKRGMHGYVPEHPDMSALFLALGRGVPAHLSLESVRAIDLAPTVSGLLGIEAPEASEGRPIPGIEVAP